MIASPWRIEAVRLATKYMTPVILLTDGYICQLLGAVEHSGHRRYGAVRSDHRECRKAISPSCAIRNPCAALGGARHAGGMHRIGGIETAQGSGNFLRPGQPPAMTDLRAAKIRGIASDIPEQDIDRGDAQGDLAVVGWGSPMARSAGRLKICARTVSRSPYPCQLYLAAAANLQELLRASTRSWCPR